MALIVEVNSVEVYTEGLRIENVVTSAPDTAAFSLPDPDNEPVSGQSVVIYRDSSANTIFSGTIKTVNQGKIAPNITTGDRKYIYDIVSEDYQRQLDRTLVVNAYTSQTCLQIITDFVNNYTDPAMGFTVNNVDTGPTIDEITFNYRRVSDSIRDLAKLTGYEWYVDKDKDIHFFQKESLPAPFEIDDTAATTKISDFTIAPDYTQVRNRVYVRGSYYLSAATAETFTGDGSRRIFILGHKPHDVSALTVNGVVKTYALDNLNADDGTYNYFWNYNERYLRAADGGGGEPTPADGHVISITYKYEVPIIVRADNTVSQTAIAAIEGGTGIYEAIIKDETIDSRELAHDRAEIEVNEFGNPMINGRFTTYEHGFEAGQYVKISTTGYARYHGNYQIKRITITPVGADNVRYDVEFKTTLYELKDFLASLLAKTDEITLRDDELVDILKIVNETITVADAAPVVTRQAHPVRWGDAVAADAKWNRATWGALP